MPKLVIAAISLVIISACSDQQADDGDHVWQEQTDTIEKARDIEQLVIDAAEQKRQHVEQ